MIIERKTYVNQLLAKRWNGKVKIIAGIRRSGKSFLLSTLFKNFLIEEGVDEYSANQINKIMKMSGPFWMKEYFDRIVRSEAISNIA